MPSAKPKDISGYDGPNWFEAEGIGHWVYEKGEGPAVLVMHELPGLTTWCRELTDKIADQGFRVYLPLLFGKPESRSIFGNLARVCISKEFRVLAKDETSPITDYFRALGRKAHEDCGGDGIGVIGMCLTGNFALSLYADDNVLAPVAAQPSMPFTGGASLHMTREELAAIKAKAAQNGAGSVIGFRYQKDPMCPAAKFERLRAELGNGFDGTEIPGAKHATLTEHLDNGALEKTLSFLQAKLK